MSGRRRVYTLFGQARRGPFSVYTACSGRGTHPWVYTVCALTVRQAYALAAREVWARDAHSVGVREIYHRDRPPLRAPYLPTAA